MESVFSTYVEVILTSRQPTVIMWGILHVCGGDPDSLKEVNGTSEVFSTYVEVILYNSAH